MNYVIPLITVLLGVSSANPVPEATGLEESELAGGIFYGIDFSGTVSLDNLTCLKRQGYSGVFIRAYQPFNGGSYDPSACPNIHNAFKSGLRIEIYMTPQPFSSKTGAQQVDEMIRNLNANGIIVNSAWVQVVWIPNWSNNVVSNINFIKSITDRLRSWKVSPGIYTSPNDWLQITGNWMGPGYRTTLWYNTVSCGGPQCETPANFNDFVPFGPWQFPVIKQYAQVEQACAVNCNRNIYATSPRSMSTKMTELNEGQAIVGFIGI